MALVLRVNKKCSKWCEVGCGCAEMLFFKYMGGPFLARPHATLLLAWASGHPTTTNMSWTQDLGQNPYKDASGG